LDVKLLQRHIVNQNFARCRFVESQKQLDNG
jgi:hypothetical protein